MGWLPEPKAERLWHAVTYWTQSLPKAQSRYGCGWGRQAPAAAVGWLGWVKCQTPREIGFARALTAQHPATRSRPCEAPPRAVARSEVARETKYNTRTPLLHTMWEQSNPHRVEEYSYSTADSSLWVVVRCFIGAGRLWVQGVTADHSVSAFGSGGQPNSRQNEPQGEVPNS